MDGSNADKVYPERWCRGETRVEADLVRDNVESSHSKVADLDESWGNTIERHEIGRAHV